MSRLLPALPLLALVLAGCARDDVVYPSLAPRAVEKLGFEEPLPPPPQPVTPDPELDMEVAAATARLDKVVAEFARLSEEAEAAVARARGAAPGSEAWVVAQTALAPLDITRSETSGILAELERLSIARAATLAPPYPPLERVRGRAQAELERQDAAITRLAAVVTPA